MRSDAAPTVKDRRCYLREELTRARTNVDLWSALQVARELLAIDPSTGCLRYLRRIAEQWPSDDARLVPLKVTLLSSFSIEFTQDALVAVAFASGLRTQIHQAGFGQFRQEILDPASGLYAFSPDLVILAVEGEDWCPTAYGDFARSSDQARNAALEEFGDSLGSLIDALRKRTAAPLLIHNFAQPPFAALGTLDWTRDVPQRSLVARLNDTIAAHARRCPSTFVLDYAGLVNRVGACTWYDSRMRLYARAPIAAGAVVTLASEWARYLRALRGLNKKCLVLDLDNTLWGGVIGEDGVAGIRLGPNYPGNAFVAFQQAIVSLQRRGVILAIASKNNPEDVDEVFATHESMVLRRADFAAWQVHWKPKPTSLRAIADSLNIGLEHMVFVDDNPVECEQIRLALPMITVIQLPHEPASYVASLLEHGWFDALSMSSEDQRRADLYRQRELAESARASYSSVDDYLRDLEMELCFADVTADTLPRTAQLTQKTNQFNATTRRYNEADIASRLGDPAWLVCNVSVKDRFGDNGIVGVVMAELQDDTACIDTFLLSCRVIGRNVETAMLAWLSDRARDAGANWLLSFVIPTAKNVPVRGVFERHGFQLVAEKDAGQTVWRLTLPEHSVAWPDSFRVQLRHAGQHGRPHDSGPVTDAPFAIPAGQS